MSFKQLAGRAHRGCRRRLVMAHSRWSRRPLVPPPNRALNWLCGNCLSERLADASLIPTLLAYGEKELAVKLTRHLLSVQHDDGRFADPDESQDPVSGTGVALAGLLAVGDLAPEATDAARRAADYLLTQINGASPLEALPPLVAAAERLSCPHYAEAARRCLDRPDLLQPADPGSPLKNVGHVSNVPVFLGNLARRNRGPRVFQRAAGQLDALLQLDRRDLAEPALAELQELQPSAAVAHLRPSGLAQLALCWYRIGHWDTADRAMTWLDAHSHTLEAESAAKFYLDAHRHRVPRFFGRHAHEFPDEVSLDDGRVLAIAASIQPRHQVVEVGCGKGRFLTAILAHQPDVRCTGVDPSEGLSRHLPPDVEAVAGTVESIPFPDSSFDVAFSVEAIQHSANPERAVEEMIRIVRPGGHVIIIDKQRAQWGRLDCPPWEHWPPIDWLADRLRRGCDEVSAEPVAYDNQPADGLMIVWQGRKFA